MPKFTKESKHWNNQFHGALDKNLIDNEKSVATVQKSMKTNRLTALLVGILFLSSVSAAGMAAWYVISLRSVAKMQPKVAEIKMVVSRAQMLVNEAMEYRKRNSAIDPILQSVSPRTSLPSVPATKTPGK